MVQYMPRRTSVALAWFPFPPNSAREGYLPSAACATFLQKIRFSGGRSERMNSSYNLSIPFFWFLKPCVSFLFNMKLLLRTSPLFSTPSPDLVARAEGEAFES
jgi:hypothetical protein